MPAEWENWKHIEKPLDERKNLGTISRSTGIWLLSKKMEKKAIENIESLVLWPLDEMFLSIRGVRC